MALALGGLVCAAALADTVVYENDFVTRTSAGAVPSGEWREIKYSTGNLVNPSGTSPFSASQLQDNWILGRISSSVNGAFVADSSNYELLLCSGEKGVAKTVCVKHRLGNTFTTGVVTAQCDFRPPSDWQEADIRSVRFLLGDESFFSPDTGSKAADFLKYAAANVGVSVYTNVAGEASYKFFRYGIDLETAPTAKSGVWYRAVVTANLDTKKYGVSIFEMGNRPSLSAETPDTPVWTESALDFRNEADSVVLSGISAIGLIGYGVSGTSTNTADRAQAAQIDNVRVWHNGEECYQNVFSARRSRCLAAGTTTTTYEATGRVANRVTTNEVYILGANIVSAQSGSGVQPLGVDGWRRSHNTGAYGDFTVTNSTGGSVYLRHDPGSSKNKYGFVAHPFGSPIGSGKVRLSVDTYVPNAWTDKADTKIWVTLAGNEYFNSAPSTNNRWASVGFRRGSEVTTPTYLPRSSSGGAGDAVNPTPDAEISKGYWYRIILTADLDAATTDFSVYQLGKSNPDSSTPNGTHIFTTNGIGKISKITSVSCFSVGAYYAPVYFDNIKVWHIPAGSETETMLYENYFSSRTYHVEGCSLVGTLAKDPVGIDGWTRLSDPSGDIRLMAGDNPALSFGSLDNSANYAVHDIGGSYKSGVLTTQFDMCAPSGWKSNGNACLWLGDSQYHEGNLNGDRVFYKWAATAAGFTPDGFVVWEGDGKGGGSWTAAVSGTAPVAGHWYRFVLTTTIRRDRSDVVVYDMGTDQPTLDMPTPTTGAVAEFSEVPFRRNHASLDGISCLSVQARALNEANPLLATEYPLLIDNIRISQTLSGAVIYIR